MTPNKQLWRKNLGNVNASTCENQGSGYALVAVSVQGKPEQVCRDQFCISW